MKLEQLLDAERHIHVRSSGRYEVIQSHVSVGAINTADLKTANPKAGQPKRDMLILSRNAYFKSLTLGMTAAPSQTVHLGQSLRCEEITVTADRGNLTLLTGVNLDVYN